MDTEGALALLEANTDFRVLRRLTIKDRFADDDGAPKKLAIYLDSETTGLDPENDKVIELAMILFEYGADGKIYRVVEVFDQYQDPGFPIPNEITRITGITDEMVRGKSFDLVRIENMISKAVLLIAHNAKFDRPFVEKLSSAFEVACWACSMEDVPWRDEELESSKLEYLAYRFGFFYEGHRADIDCYAGINVLTRQLPKSHRNALATLLESARKPRFRIQAIQAPFESKNLLKSRGYRWEDISPGRKVWVTTIDESDLEKEKAYLETNVYPTGRAQYEVIKIGPRDRFSKRI